MLEGGVDGQYWWAERNLKATISAPSAMESTRTSIPALASKQGNEIGLVSVYIYIYIYICHQKKL